MTRVVYIKSESRIILRLTHIYVVNADPHNIPNLCSSPTYRVCSLKTEAFITVRKAGPIFYFHFCDYFAPFLFILVMSLFYRPFLDFLVFGTIIIIFNSRGNGIPEKFLRKNCIDRLAITLVSISVVIL